MVDVAGLDELTEYLGGLQDYVDDLWDYAQNRPRRPQSAWDKGRYGGRTKSTLKADVDGTSALKVVPPAPNPFKNQKYMHHHHYACIYSDPPWDVHAWQKNKKGEYPKSYYPTMKPAELAAMPVQDLNDPDGTHHFMWVTSSRLDQATELLHSWNYSNVSLVFGWLKTTGQDANGAHILQMGMGAETRYGMEVVLHAYSGKNPPRKDMDDVMQVVPAPVGEHSAKPAEIRQLIVELYPDLPRLEMFARNQWDGWDVFGNQVTKAVPQPAALRSQMLTVVRPERSASWWTTHKKKVFTTKEAARYISDNGDHPVGTHRVIEYIREGRLDARKSGSQWAISKRSVMEFVKEERTSGRPFKGQEPKKRTTK